MFHHFAGSISVANQEEDEAERLKASAKEQILEKKEAISDLQRRINSKDESVDKLEVGLDSSS